MGLRERIASKVIERQRDRVFSAQRPKLCTDRRMPWYPFFPSWSEVILHIQREQLRYQKRGGHITRIEMSQATWVRLCDMREKRGQRPGFGRPGQKHYDSRRLLGNPLSLNGDTPLGSVYCHGS